MKPRKRPLPVSFYEEWRYIPPDQWGLRPTFERFYNAGLDESRDVLRDLYKAVSDKMLFPPELRERVKDVLGNEKIAAVRKPKFCAICTRSRKDIFQERVNDHLSWVCTDCTVLSASDSRYCFDEAPPDLARPIGAKGRGDE